MPNLGLVFSGIDPISDVVRASKLAEQKGFEIVWWGEDFFVKDGVTPIAAIALNTERVKLGTGILSHYVHHPATIATTIATLDEISNKRMILGLGTGVNHWISYQMGISQLKPLTAMKECVSIVKKMLNEEVVTQEGEVFKCRVARLGFRPQRNQIPIYLAAMGPRMLQLAGEIADGVIPGGAGSSLKFTKRCIQNIEIGAKKANRKISDIDIHQFVITSVSDDSNKARDAIREYLAWMIGVGGDMPSQYSEDFDEDDILPIVRKVKRGDVKGATEDVTDDMVNILAAAGTPSECRNKIKSYFEMGADCVGLCPIAARGAQDLTFAIEEASKIL